MLIFNGSICHLFARGKRRHFSRPVLCGNDLQFHLFVTFKERNGWKTTKITISVAGLSESKYNSKQEVDKISQKSYLTMEVTKSYLHQIQHSLCQYKKSFIHSFIAKISIIIIWQYIQSSIQWHAKKDFDQLFLYWMQIASLMLL